MTASAKVAAIFKKYYSELNRYIAHKYDCRDEADDIVQDAFHNILNVHNLDVIENPRAYLYQAARNIALTKIRRQGYQASYLASLDSAEPFSENLDQHLLAEVDLESVRTVLNGLSEKDRRTFLLNRIDGKSYKEISLELNVTVSTVEKRMMKVLSQIRRALDE